MSVEGLHTQIDDVQYDKLNQANWISDDTPLHDIANRAIDSFQKDIRELPIQTQEKALQKLLDFLVSLGGDFNSSDLEGVLEMLSLDDSQEKYSLANGMPMFGNDYDGRTKAMDMILGDLKNKADIKKYLPYIFREVEFTQGGKGAHMMTPARQVELTQATENFYATIQEVSGISVEELQDYMIFGPKLIADIESEKVQDYFSDPENKQIKLSSLETQEEQLYFLRLWDFMNASPGDKKVVMADDSDFANRLRSKGVVEFMDYLEIPQFSQSPEIIEKKTEIFDIIASECEGPELEQMIGVYQVYLEYVGDSSQDVEDYLQKLRLFQDMLIDEFVGTWNWGYFLEKLGALFVGELGQKTLSRITKLVRTLARDVFENPLESVLFAASFCPYAGDVLDVGYGAYKLDTGKNFSGDIVNASEASIQMSFGVIGVIANIIAPGSGSILKGIKSAGKQGIKSTVSQGVENLPGAIKEDYVDLFQEVLNMGKKLDPFMKSILEIFKKMKDNFLSGIKLLKDFLVEQVMPVVKLEVGRLLQVAK